MLYESGQIETQKEEDELRLLLLKRYKIIAIVINVVFACLFCAVAVMAFFEATSYAAFIACCILSCLWTVVYNKFAHKKLSKYGKKYAYVYIVIAILICAVTILTCVKLPEDVIFVQLTDGTSLRDFMPWIIGFKCICDCGVALGLGFIFW